MGSEKANQAERVQVVEDLAARLLELLGLLGQSGQDDTTAQSEQVLHFVRPGNQEVN